LKYDLKPLPDQVIVITGASSGIGLATAYAAAERGARVVLASRNKAALDAAVATIEGKGGTALAVVADVSERSQLEALAAAAIAAYGGFDTWVNNAGVGIYGRLDVVPEAEQRRLFDVNYWGTVNGSLVAAAHLRERGGAIVNLGSILSDVSVPQQGPYCASKAAVRGFTDALRIELEHERAPVSVTLVKPGAIATPFPQHARNHMDREPTLPPPLYAPENAAAVVLHAAEHGGRDLYVGAGARAIVAMGRTVPGALDVASARVGTAAQKRYAPPDNPGGNLFEPAADGEVWGQTSYPVFGAGARNAPSRGGPIAAATVLVLAGAAMMLGRRA
jgi:short-subunit dehydrogenase